MSEDYTPPVMVPCPHCVDGRTASGYGCMNCYGRMVVALGSPDEFCGHDYVNDRTIGRCLSVWKCATCWHEITIDSS